MVAITELDTPERKGLLSDLLGITVLNALDGGAEGSAAAINATALELFNSGGGICLIPPAQSSVNPRTINGRTFGTWDVSATPITPLNGVHFLGAGVMREAIANAPDLNWNIIGGTVLDGGETGNAFELATTAQGNIAVTFDNTTNSVNLASDAGGLVNDDQIVFSSGAGALPGTVRNSDAYYIINKTGTNFQISLSRGGPAVTFADNGSGSIEYIKMNPVLQSVISRLGVVDCVNGVKLGAWNNHGAHDLRIVDFYGQNYNGLDFASDFLLNITNASMGYYQGIHGKDFRGNLRLNARTDASAPGEHTLREFSFYQTGDATGKTLRGVKLETEATNQTAFQLDLVRVYDGITLTTFSGDTSDAIHYEATAVNIAKSINNSCFNQVSSDGECEHSFYLNNVTTMSIVNPRVPPDAQISDASNLHLLADEARFLSVKCVTNAMNAQVNNVGDPWFAEGPIEVIGGDKPSTMTISTGSQPIYPLNASFEFETLAPGLGNALISKLEGTTYASIGIFPVNPFPQSGSYAMGNTRPCVQTYTGAGGDTFTLPTIASSAFGAYYLIINRGSGSLTVARNGANINDAASDATLPAGSWAVFACDKANGRTNWRAFGATNIV